MPAARSEEHRYGLCALLVVVGSLLACHARADEPRHLPAPLPVLGVPRAPAGALKEDGIRPAALQPVPPGTTQEELLLEMIQLTPPGPQRLFQLESEESWRERIRQEGLRRALPMLAGFPPSKVVLTTEQRLPRLWPTLVELVEPNYVCHRRLFFEQKNFERYGWDVGIWQPALSAGLFYYDVLTLPVDLLTWPCRRFECSAGYCLPGDPVPYLLYPPRAR